jgi:hypothetical protein
VPITGSMNRLFAQDAPEAADPKLRLVRSDATPVVASTRLAPPAEDAPKFTFSLVAQEDAIVATLAGAANPHELASEAFRRKEHKLGALFALLSPIDSLELDRRLSVSSPDDPIASRFVRLVPERRGRLIAFLRDTRRRAAVLKSKSR